MGRKWAFKAKDDGTLSDWVGPYASGEEAEISHIFSAKGTYTIEAKAKDVFGDEGPIGTIPVTMPRNKPFNFNFNLLGWLFERFPNAFPILRQLLGL